jgi:hypothetical protein
MNDTNKKKILFVLKRKMEMINSSFIIYYGSNQKEMKQHHQL